MPLSPDTTIATPRLIVRIIREADLPDLFEVNGDDAVTRFLPYATWRTPADGEAWFARMNGLQAKGDCWQFVLEHRELRRAIGTCLLFRHDEKHARAELGYALGRAHWGRGHMQEALGAFVDFVFAELKLARLEAEIDPRNEASARLLRRLGFVPEGWLRQRWQGKGERIDSALYGLLRGEGRAGVPRSGGPALV